MSEPGLERAFLGDEPRFTDEDVATQAGVSVDVVRRMWRSLGFAESGTDEATFTPADVEAVRTVGGLLEETPVDLDLALNITRGIGLSMNRLAEWEVGALAQGLAEGTEIDGIPVSSRAGAAHVIEVFGERFDRLVTYAWRRHLIAAVVRLEASRAIDETPGSTDVTVGFADLVNFTGLSNELSRERIGELVELFETRCSDVITIEGGRLIKSLGDAVLFINDDPLRAFATAEGIINVIGRDKRMPDIRIGLASGAVVMRHGDVYGPPVNLASRLTQVARRNRIIIDDLTAERLPSEQIETRHLASRPLRGFGLIEPLTARRR